MHTNCQCTACTRQKFIVALHELQPESFELSKDAPLLPAPSLKPNDPRVDVGAKFSLQRMLKSPSKRADAVRLINGINSGKLAGIYGDDLAAAVQVARRHTTERWLLIPKGEDAILALEPANPATLSPTIIFRGDTPNIRYDYNRIDNALQKVSKTYQLWLAKQVVFCDLSSFDRRTPFESLNSTRVNNIRSISNIKPIGICQRPDFVPPDLLDKEPPKAFPNKYDGQFIIDQTTQDQLNQAFGQAVAKYGPGLNNLAITIIKVNRGSNFYPIVSVNGHLMHFSASLLKVAAIYAAFELRSAAKRLVEILDPQTEKDFFDKLEREFTPQILQQLNSMLSKGKIFDCPQNNPKRPLPCPQDRKLNLTLKKPDYKRVLQVKRLLGNTRLQVEFKNEFLQNLKMIVINQGSNSHAQFCIKSLGYGYIAGALEKAGLFDSDTGKGIWLAACYDDFCTPGICVNSENDQEVAQAMTTNDFARLLSLLFDNKLFEGVLACQEMLNILSKGKNLSFLRRSLKNPRQFNVTHSKLGDAVLKKGGDVFSEGLFLLRDTNNYAIVWQNYPESFFNKSDFAPIAEIIQNTI